MADVTIIKPEPPRVIVRGDGKTVVIVRSMGVPGRPGPPGQPGGGGGGSAWGQKDW